MIEEIDRLGYRPNVGIMICNQKNQLLWAKRSDRQAWQFPQGGIHPGEEVEQAMYRELLEEVGLHPEAVTRLSRTRRWLYYRLPQPLIRWHEQPVCIGQKQLWFLLRLTGDDGCINLTTSQHPEFDDWRWVSYWYPIRKITAFKRYVYRQVMREFAAVLMPPQARYQQRPWHPALLNC